jgi:hypothetical protein
MGLSFHGDVWRAQDMDPRNALLRIEQQSFLMLQRVVDTAMTGVNG